MNQQNDWNATLAKLDTLLTLYLVKKAPSLPDNIKELIVKYGPYLSLIMVVLTLPAIAFAFGLSSLFAPFAYLGGVRYGSTFGIGTLFSIAFIVLNLIALPGLFKRKLASWNFLFYATLVNAVYQLLSLSLGNLIIGTAISLYILYQVKSYYK